MTDERLGILLVEDERQLARAISRTLRTQGFDVVAAPSSAMARVLDCRFKVGVFDIDLGDGSGVDLARELLASGRVSQAVFFTATTAVAELEAAAALGPVVSKCEGVDALLPVLIQAIPNVAPRASGVMPAIIDSVELAKRWRVG